MGAAAPLTFQNGILPLGLLILLAVFLPALLAGQTLSQPRLAAAMLVTAGVVWLAGAALMALQTWQANGALLAGVGTYFRRSLLLGLLYGPVLALVWLMRAQGIERRRGLLMTEVGR
jgi:hypothetical protein